MIQRGACPFCYTEKRCTKSGINSYLCSYCGVTFTIGKDYIIAEWYIIKHGRRILRSNRLYADSGRWKEMVEYMGKKH